MSFKNLTGNISEDFLAEMQHEALYQELGKISQVKTIKDSGHPNNFQIRKEQDVSI